MILTYDIETYEEDKDGYLIPTLNCQKFKLGAIMKENGIVEFFEDPNKMGDRIIELIEKEAKRGKRTYIYGHNAQYDFYGVFRDRIKKSLIMNFENGKTIKYLSYNPFMAIYGKKGDSWEFKENAYFLDTMGFYRMSLGDVGKIVELEKLEMPMKLKNIEELKVYLKRDVEITMKGIKAIKETINNMGFKPKRLLTAGNVAITCFLTWCKKNKLSWIFSENGQTYQGLEVNNIRPAFRGGRTECFETGIFEDCIKIDCNSMYPYIMANMDFPLLNTEYKVEGQDSIYHLHKIGVMSLRIKAPQIGSIKYGYLPIRFAGMVHFPLGKELKGIWTTQEIRKALSLGYKIESIDWGVFYDTSKINPFKKYIELLWDRRVNAKSKEESKVIKLLMNSLFGKWGQYRADEDMRIIDRKEFTEYKKIGYDFLKVSGTKYIVSKKGKIKLPRYANPLISMLITAGGRDYLYDTMNKIPKENLIYVATDGLIIKAKDINTIDTYNICLGYGLGEFKVEEKGICRMFGENRYMFNENVKVGGIPKRDMTKEVLYGERKVKTHKMISIKEALINSEFKEKVGTFREEEIQIRRSCKNDILLPSKVEERNKFKVGEGI